jgi:hypothetical protein
MVLYKTTPFFYFIYLAPRIVTHGGQTISLYVVLNALNAKYVLVVDE